MKNLEKRVEEKMNELLEGNDLNKVLWHMGLQTPQGPVGHQGLVGYDDDVCAEAIDMAEKMAYDMMDFYTDWTNKKVSDLLSGMNDEFNDDVEGMEEEEKADYAYDWVDCDGWVFIAFTGLVATVINEVMNDMASENWETERHNFAQKLYDLGLECDDVIGYDEDGYEFIKGVSAWNKDDYFDLTCVIEWDYDRWVFYCTKDLEDTVEVDSFEEVVKFFEANLELI